MATTSAPVTSSGNSGTTCNKSGPYVSNRNAKITVFIAKGQVFPKDADGANTTWSMPSSAAQTTNQQLVS